MANYADVPQNLIAVVVYEPTLGATDFSGFEIVPSLDVFKQRCDVVLANHWSEELADVQDKVYTRDLFRRD